MALRPDIDRLFREIRRINLRISGLLLNGTSTTDLTVTNPVQGDTLEYNGTTFVNVNNTCTELIGTIWDGSNKYKTLLSSNLALTLNSTKVAGLLVIEDNNNYTLTINGTNVPINTTAATVLGFVKANGVYYVIDKDGLTVQLAAADVTAPTVVSATAIDANTIRIVFSEAMGAVTTAGHSFKQNGTPINPDSVSGAGTTWNFVVSETLLSSDTILRSYNSGTGATTDDASNELASYTDAAVTNSIPSLQDINFTTVTSGFAKTSNYWSGPNMGLYNNFGLSTQLFSGDGYIEFEYAALDGRDAIIALRETSVNESYQSGNYKAAAWVSSAGGGIYRIDNNAIAGISNIPAIGDFIRISRIGSTIKLQKRSGATITDVYTYTYSSSADLYIQANTNETARLYDPKGSNLV